MVKEKNRRSIIIIIAGLLVLGLFGVAGWWLMERSKYVITDNAQIDASIIIISSQIAEKIEDITVDEGQKIRENQIVARLTDNTLRAKKTQVESELQAAKDSAEEYLAKVEVAKAKLTELEAGFRPEEKEQARANLREAKAKLDEARTNFQRASDLYKTGIISVDKKDEAEANFRVAEEKYKSLQEKLNMTLSGTRPEAIAIAKAELTQAHKAYKSALSKIKLAETALEVIEQELAKTVIKAPLSGLVAKKQVDKGEYIQPGQPIIALIDTKDIWIKANIKETEFGRVQPGQPVSFKLDAYPGQTFKGKVLEIIPATGAKFALIPKDNAQGNFTKITQLIPIKISIDGLEQYNGQLLPGMSAGIKIRVKEEEKPPGK